MARFEIFIINSRANCLLYSKAYKVHVSRVSPGERKGGWCETASVVIDSCKDVFEHISFSLDQFTLARHRLDQLIECMLSSSASYFI